MDIEEKISLLTNPNHGLAYQALKELMQRSEDCDQVYPYFEQFVAMMNHPDHSYIRSRGLRLIAGNAKWDKENKVNRIITDYLKHIEDEKPITARQCIKDTVIIAKYKPELIPIICDALEKYNHIYEESMQSLVYQDRKKALRQIQAMMEF